VELPIDTTSGHLISVRRRVEHVPIRWSKLGRFWLHLFLRLRMTATRKITAIIDRCGAALKRLAPSQVWAIGGFCFITASNSSARLF
jgi:hypothetical protein